MEEKFEINNEEKQPGWWARQKMKIDNKVQDALNNATIEAQKKYYDRWMKLSHCHHPSQIDYSIPQIELESKLCDIYNIKLIKNGKRRDEFLAILSPEAREMYFEKGSDGKYYTELEKPKVLRSMITGIKKKWRKKYKTEMTPEEEQFFDDFIEDDAD